MEALNSGTTTTTTLLTAMDQDLLEQVMQHVPLGSRLRAASVCSRWQKAAIAATRSVAASPVTSAAFESLHGWLERHGGHITSLELNGFKVSEVQLSAAVATLHNLRYLHCNVSSTDPVRVGDGGGGGSCLQHLTALTHLNLNVDDSFDEADWYSHVSCLRTLRYLYLEAYCGTYLSCAGWEHLQQLTALDLRYLECYKEHIIGLQSLTRLQELALQHTTCLAFPDLMTITQLQSVEVYSFFDSLHDLTGLPAWLAQQQQLTRLLYTPLEFTTLFEGEAAVQHDAEAKFRQVCVITAQLSVIKHLRHLDFDEFTAPRQTWRDLFAGGRQLAELTYLKAPLWFCEPPLDRNSDSDPDCLEPADVQAMVACCPALQVLDAGRILHVGPELHGLKHLTHLQALWPRDAAAAAVLTRLTGLHHLQMCMHCCDDATPLVCQLVSPAVDETVCLLSQLTRLTTLYIRLGRFGDKPDPPRLSTAAVAGLACCASLVELVLLHVVVEDALLLQLSASHTKLTSLCFHGQTGSPLVSESLRHQRATASVRLFNVPYHGYRGGPIPVRLETRDDMSVAQQLLQCSAKAKAGATTS